MKLPKFLKTPLGSLPSLQELPVIFIVRQLNPIHNQPSHFFKIHFNIILQIKTWFSKLSLYFGFLPKTLYVVPCFPLCKSQPSWKNREINIKKNIVFSDLNNLQISTFLRTLAPV